MKFKLTAAAIIVLSSLCGYWLNYIEELDTHYDVATNIAEISPEIEFKKILVNINTAGLTELVALPGIGEQKANAIIEYREEHEKFYDISEIMNVSGIGEYTYETIKDKITIE